MILICPECNNELKETTLLGNPPLYEVYCNNCEFKLKYYDREESYLKITQKEINNFYKPKKNKENPNFLNCLVDKNIKIPDPDGEYIYNFHMLFKNGVGYYKERTIYIVPGEKIAINVRSVLTGKEVVHNGFSFNIKGEEGEYHCNYPWAFVENTPENIIKLKKYYDLCNEIKKMKKNAQELFKNIKTLENK